MPARRMCMHPGCVTLFYPPNGVTGDAARLCREHRCPNLGDSVHAPTNHAPNKEQVRREQEEPRDLLANESNEHDHAVALLLTEHGACHERVGHGNKTTNGLKVIR